MIAKNVLNKYDIPPEKMKVLEIDRERDCSKIQDYMQQITGGRTVFKKNDSEKPFTRYQVNLDSIYFQVPRVFIKGECIGGGNETSSAHKSGVLERKLRAAGAIV